jgi:N-acyl-D-aspartate/D-glutamate deacylase
MGDECQGRTATAAEVEAMREVVRGGIQAGAIGLSVDRNKGHYDPQGINIPAFWADDEEVFALGDVLGELGTGVIQAGGGSPAELRNRLMTRLSEATGRQVIYNNLIHSSKKPDQWKEHMVLIEETVKAGIRANPGSSSKNSVVHFTMHNAQEFRGVPTWHPILTAPDEEKLRAYADPEIRKKLHEEVIEWKYDISGKTSSTFGKNWFDKMSVGKAALPKNKGLEGKTVREVAEAQGKGIIDAFLDLAIEEKLDTIFVRSASNTNKEIAATILNYPHAYIGLSDSGAHVQFQSGYGYSSRLLGYWVREEHIMSLERAINRLTFENASVFGIYDRGLLRPGMAGDIVIFNPDTIASLPEDVVRDYPGGGWRMRELAKGVHYTVVNGQVLLEDGKHTGALPGRVLRNSLYHETHA